MVKINQLRISTFVILLVLLILATGGRVVEHQPVLAFPDLTVRYVAHDGVDTGDCTDSLHPCGTVQYAVNQANDGDEIRIAADTYTGFNTLGGLRQHVYLNKSVTIRGGYTRGDWMVSRPDVNLTVLDALGLGRAFYVTGNISTTIEGLRITGGNPEGLGGWLDRDCGGGIYGDNVDVRMSNCEVFSNTANAGGGIFLMNSQVVLSGDKIVGNDAGYDQHNIGSGGGVFLENCEATVIGNTIIDNVGDHGGGGAQIQTSNTVFQDNVVSNNSGYYYGGGLLVAAGNFTCTANTIMSNTSRRGGGVALRGSVGLSANLEGNEIRENSVVEIWGTYGYGGGIWLENCNTDLVNNLIADNYAEGRGSGMYIEGVSSLMQHNTIARNIGGDGSGVYITSYHESGDIYYYTNALLVNSIIVSHTVGVTVTLDNTARLESTLWGDGDWGNGTNAGGTGTVISNTNVVGDPQFANPSIDDYHIGSNSAARDAGENAGVSSDIDGEWRFDGHPDIGADEFVEHVYLPLVFKD